MTSTKAVSHFVNAALYLILTIIFYVYYMRDALIKFNNGDTTIAMKTESSKTYEAPIILLCLKPGFKPSFFKDNNLTDPGIHDFFWVESQSNGFPHQHWSQFESLTMWELYKEMSFVYKKDFNIHFFQGSSGTPVAIMLSLDDQSNEFADFTQVPTVMNGLCYKIKPKANMTAASSYFGIFMMTNNKEITGYELKVADAKTWPTLVNGQWTKTNQPYVTDIAINQNQTTIHMVNLVQNSWQQMNGFDDLNDCLNQGLNHDKCLSFFNPLAPMNSPNLCNGKNDFFNQSRNAFEALSHCSQPKAYKIYNGFESKVARSPVSGVTTFRFDQVQFVFGSKESNHYTEIPVFDILGLMSSVGGSLGLFIGFSFFGFFSTLFEVLKSMFLYLKRK